MRRIVSLDVTRRYVAVRGDQGCLNLSSLFCGTEERKGLYSLPWSPWAVQGYLQLLEQKRIGIHRTKRFDDWLRQEISLREQIKSADAVEKPNGTPLFRHQVAFAFRSEIAPCQYDASELGTGKSVSALAAIDYLRARRVLILAPNIILKQWENYIREWSDLEPIVFAPAPRSERVALLRTLPDDFALIVSWDSLPRYNLAKIDWDAIIGDEFHFVRNRKTKRFEALNSLDAPIKIALSGTPFEKSAADLFTFLQWTDYRYTSYWRMAKHLANVYHDEWADTWEVEGIRDPEIFADVMAPYMRRLELSQLSDVPETVFEVIPLEMSEQHQKIYQEYGLLLKGRDHPMKILQQLRLLAFDPGLLGINLEEVPVGVEAAENLLKEIDHAVVFGSRLPILGRMKGDHPLLHAQVPMEKRERILENFSRGGKVFMTPQLGGIGLDLRHCQYAVFLDLPWSYTQFTQSCGRIRRLTSGGRSVVVVLVVLGTIQERIWEVLRNKQELSKSALERLIVEHVESLERRQVT